MTRAAIDSYEGGRAIPPYSKLKIIAEYFGKNVEDLTEKKLWMQVTEQEEIWKERTEEDTFDQKDSKPFDGRNIEIGRSTIGEIPVLKSTQFDQFCNSDFKVEADASEFLSVPVRAQFSGELLAFEATKDFPVSGSMIIAERLPSLYETLDNECYLIVTKGAIVYRRVFNQLKTRRVLVLTPEIPDLATIDLSVNEIISIWKPAAVLSFQMPEMKQNASEARKLLAQLKAELDRLD